MATPPTPTLPNPAAAALAGAGEPLTAAPQEVVAEAQAQAQAEGLALAQQETDIVEVDDRDDVDSAFGSGGSSNFTVSLTSSVFNYTYENGRRYHAYNSGEYPFPNDYKEQKREDLKHHVFKLVLGGELHLAPIGPDPQRILDVGTGTGTWAIDMADHYPSAQVHGIDLSPIQPRWVPPNCSFVVDNAEDEWLYSPSQAFDLIHLRAMSGSMKDWPNLYSQAFQHLKPGGWVEAQDHDVKLGSDDDSVEKAKDWVNWMKTANEVAEKFGKILDVGPRQKQWMIDAGFVDIREEIFKVPVGRWPKDRRLKEQGVWLQALNADALEPVSMALFTRVLNKSTQEVQDMLVGPRKDIYNPEFHLYIKWRFTYGRKPRPSES